MEKTRPAATKKFNLAPTLRRAVPSRFPSPLPSHLRLLAWVITTTFASVFYLGPIILMSPPVVAALFGWKIGLLAAAVVAYLALVPVKEWVWVRGVFQLLYEIFDFKHNLNTTGPEPVKFTDDYEKLTIIAMHPHGIVPIQALLWSAFCDQYLPGMYGFGATTDIALKVPLLRHFLGWLTAFSADRKVLQKGLDKGTNLFILPGGVGEIFLSQPHTHTILAKRRGLVKLALRSGAQICPAYVFGGTNFFHQIATAEGILGSMSRMIRAGFTLFWGKYLLPIPLDTSVALVIGDPLPFKKCSDPSPEQVEEGVERLSDAMHRLFEQYKVQAGYPDSNITIQ